MQVALEIGEQEKMQDDVTVYELLARFVGRKISDHIGRV